MIEDKDHRKGEGSGGWMRKRIEWSGRSEEWEMRKMKEENGENCSGATTILIRNSLCKELFFISKKFLNYNLTREIFNDRNVYSTHYQVSSLKLTILF